MLDGGGLPDSFDKMLAGMHAVEQVTGVFGKETLQENI